MSRSSLDKAIQPTLSSAASPEVQLTRHEHELVANQYIRGHQRHRTQKAWQQRSARGQAFMQEKRQHDMDREFGLQRSLSSFDGTTPRQASQHRWAGSTSVGDGPPVSYTHSEAGPHALCGERCACRAHTVAPDAVATDGTTPDALAPATHDKSNRSRGAAPSAPSVTPTCGYDDTCEIAIRELIAELRLVLQQQADVLQRLEIVLRLAIEHHPNAHSRC